MSDSMLQRKVLPSWELNDDYHNHSAHSEFIIQFSASRSSSKYSSFVFSDITDSRSSKVSVKIVPKLECLLKMWVKVMRESNEGEKGQ
jgi:hypothetical protein